MIRVFQIFLDFLESDTFPDKEAEREPERLRRAKKSSKGVKVVKVDLHGKTLDEAISFLDSYIATLKQKRAYIRLKIVTGKGLNSGFNGPVLANEVHGYIESRYSLNIVDIEESPGDLKINNMPIRGYFHVTFKF